jgi:VanZ family protein
MRERAWIIALRYGIPFVCYAVIILYLSTKTSDALPKFTINDKILHLIEYTGFGFLLFRFCRRIMDTSFLILLAITLIGGTSFALLDEWVQSSVATRMASTGDIVADVCGIMIGVTLYTLTKQYGSKDEANCV